MHPNSSGGSYLHTAKHLKNDCRLKGKVTQTFFLGHRQEAGPPPILAGPRTRTADESLHSVPRIHGRHGFQSSGDADAGVIRVERGLQKTLPV